MPVSPCICCGCCACADVVAGLASSYTVDVTGTWDDFGFDPGCNPCDGDTTVIYVMGQHPGQVGTCTYGDASGLDVCLAGRWVNTVYLELICNKWQLTLRFFDLSTCEAIEDGPYFVYRQRTPDCADPTGDYDLYFADYFQSPNWDGVHSYINPAITCPATITVS